MITVGDGEERRERAPSPFSEDGLLTHEVHITEDRKYYLYCNQSITGTPADIPFPINQIGPGVRVAMITTPFSVKVD